MATASNITLLEKVLKNSHLKKSLQYLTYFGRTLETSQQIFDPSMQYLFIRVVKNCKAMSRPLILKKKEVRS